MSEQERPLVQSERKSFHGKIVDPVKAAFAAAVFTTAISLAGCGSANRQSSVDCPPEPTTTQVEGMSDTKLRECLEASDREGHRSYGGYYGYYIGRGFGYDRGSYRPAPSGSAFRGASGSGSAGPSYKSGSGGTFSGGSKSSGAGG